MIKMSDSPSPPFLLARQTLLIVWLPETAACPYLRDLQHLGRLALLDNAAVVHEDQPVADISGETHFVSDHDHRHASIRELAHLVENASDQLGSSAIG